DTDQDRVLLHGGCQLLGRDVTCLVDWKISYRKTFVFQLATCLKDRTVFDPGRHHVTPPTLISPDCTPNSQVVGLRAPGSKHDFSRPGTQRVGDRTAGVLDALFRINSFSMEGRWVAVILGHRGQDALRDLGQYRGRRRIVQVNVACSQVSHLLTPRIALLSYQLYNKKRSSAQTGELRFLRSTSRCSL